MVASKNTDPKSTKEEINKDANEPTKPIKEMTAEEKKKAAIAEMAEDLSDEDQQLKDELLLCCERLKVKKIIKF
jgi:hypothetical protein